VQRQPFLERKGRGIAGPERSSPPRCSDRRSNRVPAACAARADLKEISEFGNELRRFGPQLRLNGFAINFEQRRGERIVTLTAAGATKSQPSTGAPHHESSRLYRWNGSSPAPSRKPKQANELRRKPHL
jgi:hypothetical protein